MSLKPLQRCAEVRRLKDDIETQHKAKADRDSDAIDVFMAATAGYQLREWLPVGILRKFLARLCVALGALGLLVGNYWLLIFFLIAGTFSPRLVGECAYFLGRVSRLFR